MCLCRPKFGGYSRLDPIAPRNVRQYSSRQLAIADVLLHYGAGSLQQDHDLDSGFSLAPPGICASKTMDACWPRLQLRDLLVRRVEILADLSCNPALWTTSKDFQKQSKFFCGSAPPPAKRCRFVGRVQREAHCASSSLQGSSR